MKSLISRFVFYQLLVIFICFALPINAQTSTTVYKVQLGAYKNLKSVNFSKLDEVEGKLLTDRVNNGLVRVLKGDYYTREKANVALAKIKALGFPDAFIRKDKKTTKLVDSAVKTPVVQVNLRNIPSASSKSKKETKPSIPKASIAKPAAVATSIVKNTNNGKYLIQIGAYKGSSNVSWNKVEDLGELYSNTSKGWTKVMVGRFANYSDAKHALGNIRARGYKSAFIRNYSGESKLGESSVDVLVKASSTTAKKKTTSKSSKKPVVASTTKKTPPKKTVTAPKKTTPKKTTLAAKPPKKASTPKKKATPKKEVVVAKKPKVEVPRSKKVATPAPSAESAASRALNELNSFFNYESVIGKHIHMDMRESDGACPENILEDDLVSFMDSLRRKPGANYYANYRFRIDDDHVAYMVRSENASKYSNCIKLHVYNKRKKRFVDSQFLSCKSTGSSLYQNSETVIVKYNNDDIPDLLQRIVIRQPNGSKSDVVKVWVWESDNYKGRSIKGNEGRFSKELDILGVPRP